MNPENISLAAHGLGPTRRSYPKIVEKITLIDPPKPKTRYQFDFVQHHHVQGKGRFLKCPDNAVKSIDVQNPILLPLFLQKYKYFLRQANGSHFLSQKDLFTIKQSRASAFIFSFSKWQNRLANLRRLAAKFSGSFEFDLISIFWKELLASLGDGGNKVSSVSIKL